MSSVEAAGISPDEAKFIVRDTLPWSGAREMRVELDKKSLFALASDTRLEMLKSLQTMRRTVSQLSEELGIDKGAIHRHLKKMEEGGLVKRYEEHGFVYYGLTWKARDLMAPNEHTRVVIILSALWIFSIVSVFFLFASFMVVSDGASETGLIPRSDGYDELSQELGAYDRAPFLLPVVVFASAAAVLAVVAFRLIRKPLQGSPEKSIGLDLPDQADIDD